MKNKAKKIILIFISAFLLNWVWENAHSILYTHYRGGPITKLILLRAAAIDAIFITLFCLMFLKWEFLRKRLWISLIIGIMAAILLEWYALKTGRWSYKDAMPLIPIINTGLTPTIQLGLLSYIIFKYIFRMDRK